jgi:hypothetical protein
VRGAARQDPLRLHAGGDHDPARRRPQPIDVELVVRAGDDRLAEQRIGAVAAVLGRHPEHRRVRSRLLRPVVRELAGVADEGDEVSHPRAGAAAHVRLVHRPRSGERVLAVGEQRRDRRLVSHDRAHVLGMRGGQRQGVGRATAAAEQVHGAANLLDEPMEVIRVLLRRRR